LFLASALAIVMIFSSRCYNMQLCHKLQKQQQALALIACCVGVAVDCAAAVGVAVEVGKAINRIKMKMKVKL